MADQGDVHDEYQSLEAWDGGKIDSRALVVETVISGYNLGRKMEDRV